MKEKFIEKILKENKLKTLENPDQEWNEILSKTQVPAPREKPCLSKILQGLSLSALCLTFTSLYFQQASVKLDQSLAIELLFEDFNDSNDELYSWIE